MRIEFLEQVRIGTQTYEAGDRLSFPEAEAKQYISLGWAKDPETGEQGERVPGSNGPLSVDAVTQTI